MPKSNHIGKLFVFIGAVLWSINAPLVKLLDLNPLLVCGLRSLIAGITLSPFLFFKKIHFSPWVFLYMISYSALCSSIIIALQYTSATIAIGMQYSSIIWIFLGYTLYKKTFSIRKFIPVFFILIGVVCFMLSGLTSGTLFGNFVALTEGFSFALMTISFQKAQVKNPIGVTSLSNLCCGIIIFIFSSTTITDLFILSLKDWIILSILGIVQVGLGYTFFNLGVQRTSAQSAAIISLWEMILGPVWVALFLGEYPTLSVFIGFLVILFGMLLNTHFNQ